MGIPLIMELYYTTFTLNECKTHEESKRHTSIFFFHDIKLLRHWSVPFLAKCRIGGTLNLIPKLESLEYFPNFSIFHVAKLEMVEHLEVAVRPFLNFGNFGKLESLENMLLLL